MQSTWQGDRHSPLLSPTTAGKRIKLKPLKKGSWRRNKMISKSLHLQYIKSGGMSLKKHEYLRLMEENPDLYRSVNNQSLQPSYNETMLSPEE
mmetsp:Transcript_12648/g.17076  ORF Transcript_12648/g.17076 Transcript_12648/m.17076 type:complete len:93 (+) Transcript_12648:1054-1332(+)